MKILLPYIKYGNLGIDSNAVFGGVERFQQLVYRNIPNIQPVYIPKDEEIDRNESKDILQQAIEQHKPDIIFSNNSIPSTSTNLAKYGIKQVHIHHEPLERSMIIIDRLRRMLDMIDTGADVYFVSEPQYDFYSALAKRFYNKTIKIKGFVNSAYANPSATPQSINYHVSTIGRNITTKDPFWLHRKLRDPHITSLVMTSVESEYRDLTLITSIWNQISTGNSQDIPKED